MKVILEYNGTISSVLHWSQEFLAYNFTIIHCLCKMMQGLDSLTCRFGKLIISHLCILALPHNTDVKNRTTAFSPDTSQTYKSKVNCKCTVSSGSAPILTSSYVHSYDYPTTVISPTIIPLDVSSSPILLCHTSTHLSNSQTT